MNCWVLWGLLLCLENVTSFDRSQQPAQAHQTQQPHPFCGAIDATLPICPFRDLTLGGLGRRESFSTTPTFQNVTKASPTSPKLSFESHYIVGMKQYKNIEDHVSYVENILDQLRTPVEWTHIPRNNPAMKYPTDFIIIALPGVKSDPHPTLAALRNGHAIRYVTQERRISAKQLLTLEDDDVGDQCDDTDICGIDSRHHMRGATMFPPVDMDELDGAPLSRKLLSDMSITERYGAPELWAKGFTGKDVRIAVFDTGIQKSHPHFRNVREITDWTDDNQLEDNIGHGTFVAGIIASKSDCLGFAPDAEVYAFRVFTNKRVSFTSWFLDAFNHAIKQKINVLNLSIGGPDFLDMPFVEKVNEMSAKNIIVVSALGNDGPKWGTLNNPADQPDVIGVGGITYHHTIASFSSRGMTTWEIPHGYGRVKPDVVAYGKNVRGSKMKSGCRTLSGTSVASPVVAGAIVLLSSTFPLEERYDRINPASMKQILVETAVVIDDAGLYEQGYGNINLLEAHKMLQSYEPKATALPSSLDFTNCPYFYPFCSQELYYGSMPVLFNVTIQNGMSATGYIHKPPVWTPTTGEAQLDVEFTYSEVVWPWSGFVGLIITVNKDMDYAPGTVASGTISLTVTSDNGKDSHIEIPLKANVIRTPPRSKRLLWDQFHQLRYPSGYFPRDNLDIKDDLLDWHGDHLHTNYRDFYQVVRELGYYIEILGTDYTCFDATQYSTLIIADTEDEFFATEINKLEDDIKHKGLSIFIAAEWYNPEKMKKLKFFDENSNSWWTPLTGGSNVPALNDLLAMFGMSLSDRVYKGELSIGDHHTMYSAGTSISRFPSQSYVVTSDMQDISGTKPTPKTNIAVLGLYDLFWVKTSSIDVGNGTDGADLFPGGDRDDSLSDANIISSSGKGRGGRIAVYGDSGCLDLSYREEECRWLTEAVLAFTSRGHIDETVIPDTFYRENRFESAAGNIPQRLDTKAFDKQSRTMKRGSFPKCAFESHNSVQTQTGGVSIPQNQIQPSIEIKKPHNNVPNGRIDQLSGNIPPVNIVDKDSSVDISLFVIVSVITGLGLFFLIFARRLLLKRRSRHLPQYIN